MTPSELKYQILEHRPDSHFFDARTMKTFGDSMKNYGVRPATITTWTDENVEVWELYRKRPVTNNLQTSAYFDKETFAQRFAYQEVL